MAGYSGTPLWKKLGIKPAMAATVIDPPAEYFDWIADGPAANWGPLRQGCDFIHLFTPWIAQVETCLADALDLMSRDGMIWLSWPKKAAGLPTDIVEDRLRDVALPLGLVDVKVCAVSDIWSGLKVVIRKELC